VTGRSLKQAILSFKVRLKAIITVHIQSHSNKQRVTEEGNALQFFVNGEEKCREKG
jgi:hypothetical protein